MSSLYADLPYNKENIDGIPKDEIQLTIPVKMFIDTLLMTIRRESITYCGKRKKARKEEEEKLI